MAVDMIKTLADFFYTIEKEIAELKSGEVELPVARAITSKRQLQQKTIALELQNRRISRLSPDQEHYRLFGVVHSENGAKKDKRKRLN